MDNVSGLLHAAWRSCFGKNYRKRKSHMAIIPLAGMIGMIETSVLIGPKWCRKERKSSPRVMSTDNT